MTAFVKSRWYHEKQKNEFHFQFDLIYSTGIIYNL